MSDRREFHLPKRTIHRVQYFLSSKEAVRTTILSKAWRRAWLTRPNLDFDLSDFASDCYFPSYGVKPFSEFARKTMKSYELWGRKIQSFSLRMEPQIRLHVYPKLEIATELITRALKIGDTRLSVSVRINFGAGYVLPNEVFESENLVHLNVKGCNINRRQLLQVRCSRLESFSLDRLRLDDSCVISLILSRCPLVQRLSLSHISLPEDEHDDDDKYDYDYDYDYDFDDDDYDYDDGRIIPHGLRSLVLKYVDFDTLFLSDLSSKFPSLKTLSLYMCCDEGKEEEEEEEGEEILISSPTLKHLTFILQRSPFRRVKFDVPNIRKFTYEGTVVPSLSFRTTSREWESRVFIRHHQCLGTSWFRRLNKFLHKLSGSRISLALHVCYTRSFDYKAENIQGLAPLEIENLTMDFEGLPSLSCYVLLDGLFRICHPKLITQYVSGRLCRSSKNIDFLGHTLLLGLNVRISTPSQFMYGLNDLDYARGKIFDETISMWRDMELVSILNDSTAPTVCFQLNWQSFHKIVCGRVPRDPLDLIPLPIKVPSNAIGADIVIQTQQLHLDTNAWRDDDTPKYKAFPNKRRCKVDFEVGDFVWIFLTKKRLPGHEHSKLVARKIGPVEIVEKINSNAYRLRLPRHIRMSDVLNVKHLIGALYW